MCAFPFLSEKNFETGSFSEWSSETDTQVKLSCDHYVTLAKQGFNPLRGAYCAHINQAIGTSTTQAILTETANFDTAAAGTIHIGFAFYASGLSMAASDVATIFSLDAAGPTAEASIQIYNNAGSIEIRGGDPGGGTYRAYPLVQNKWHWVEMSCLIDSGAGNDGTIDWYLDGTQVGAQITAVDQGAITQARLGAHSITGCVGGHLLFDQVMADDARIYLYYPRYPRSLNHTKTSHIFVGPGSIASAELLSTGASDSAIFYDTDVGYSSAAQQSVASLDTTAWTALEGPIYFQRGCYLVLSGANPRCAVEVNIDQDSGGAIPGPIYYSDALMKIYALQRRTRSYGI